jgi:ABC-2 type transport system permease protein
MISGSSKGGSLWREISALTLVRIKIFVREPEAIFWVVVFPVLLTVVLGYAFRTNEPGPSQVALFWDGSAAAKKLEQRLTTPLCADNDSRAWPACEGNDKKQGKEAAKPRIAIKRYRDLRVAERKLRKGAVDAIVIAAKPPRVRSDPNRPEGELAQLRIAVQLGRKRHGEIVAAERRSERGSRYIDFLFFGVLGMNLMGTGLFGVAFAVADMRQKKLLRRMLVTPMRRLSLLLSFMLSRLIFLVAELVVLVIFGALALDVPMLGNWLELAIVSVLAGFLFSGLGLLIAARAQTIEGVSGLMNLATMPMWLVSGVFFSYERFPEVLHLPIRLLPLTALNDALRAMMLDGRSLFELPFELAVMVVWATLPLAIALKSFRWD